MIDKILAGAKISDGFSDLSTEDKADADLKAEIAMHIHEKRIDMHMTQKEFAEFNGVSQTMVSKWESGEYNFSLDNLSHLMATLGLKLEIVNEPVCA